MNIDQILKSYKQKKATIETIEIRIIAYETMLRESEKDKFELTAPGEIGMPKAPGRSGSTVERAIVQRECTREDIQDLINQEKSRSFWPKLEVQQIEKSLEALTSWEKYIIECKYFDSMTWRNIEISFNRQFPQKNDLTDERLRKLSNIAISKISKILQPFYTTYESIFEKQPENNQNNTIKKPVSRNSKVYTYNIRDLQENTAR